MYPELGSSFKAAQMKVLVWGMARKLRVVLQNYQDLMYRASIMSSDICTLPPYCSPLSLSLCLSSCPLRLSLHEDEELVQMAIVVRALNKAQRLLDNSEFFMTEGDSTRFNDLVQLHLRTWQRLALKFEALGIALCKIRPKHHYLQHIGLYVAATRVNVRIHQNFNSESYMGKMKKIAVKCHSASMMLRVQQRYVLYLALSWERAKRASTGAAGAALTGNETLEELLLCDSQNDNKRSSAALAPKLPRDDASWALHDEATRAIRESAKAFECGLRGDSRLLRGLRSSTVCKAAPDEVGFGIFSPRVWSRPDPKRTPQKPSTRNPAADEPDRLRSHPFRMKLKAQSP